MTLSELKIYQKKYLTQWALWIAIASQLVTVAITWPLWQIRSEPPLLPLIPHTMPQWNFGWLMVGSCLLVSIRPWIGVWIHLVIILVACLFDEMRTQPQFFAIWVLMLTAAKPSLEPVAKWFLISMWLWAGLHKILSPDWLSHSTTDLLVRISLDPGVWHWPFAIGIAVSEIFTGVVAIFFPKKGAYLCVLMHLGIILFLSPIGLNWNYSVFPWNFATAVLGFRILRKSTTSLPHTAWECAVAGILLLYPAGFYMGWVDHGISFVFYSGHKPEGIICTGDSIDKIRGWKNINVPFPNERRLLRRYFEAVAKPGHKLHIHDPRWLLEDQFFLLVKKGDAKEISELDFRSERSTQPGLPDVKGVLLDDYVALWHIGKKGAKMLKRTKDSMVYAVEIPPDAYSQELIQLIQRIPNLEQLQLAGTSVTDADLAELAGHPSLIGLGLSETKITNQSLTTLRSIPNLRILELEGCQVDVEQINDFLAERSRSSPD